MIRNSKNMAKPAIQLAKRWAAVFCLLAVVLLQTPFARAAWLSSGVACCMGDHCGVPGHHHKNAAAEKEMPMDCGHNMSHRSDCKISCCKTADETASNVAQFVMPDLGILLSLQRAVPPILPFAPQWISRAEKPQSPPPRIALS
jgi:hypothetical protein